MKKINEKTEEIYVYLLDEGIDVWRPVDAIKLDDNIYKIISVRDSNKETETLEFNLGDTVRTVDRVLSGNFGKKNNTKVAISKLN